MQGHHSGAGRDLVLSSSIHKEFAQRDRILYGHCASTTRIFRFAPFVGGFLILPAMRVVDDYAPFSQRGGLGKAHQLFGPDLPKLLDELNEVLAA